MGRENPSIPPFGKTVGFSAGRCFYTDFFIQAPSGIAFRRPVPPGPLQAGVFAKRPSLGVYPSEPYGSPGPRKPFDSAV
jgi:hypothetical protein